MTDEYPFDESAQAKRGRLFQIRLRRNFAARTEALASLRQRPDGHWQARIGGRMHGATRVFLTRAAAEAAVHSHYSAIIAIYNAALENR